MRKKLPNMGEYAKRFGKHDMERLGLFIEMPYMPVRVKPSQKDKKLIAKEAEKAAEFAGLGNLLPGGPKTKCGNQDGYFDDEFKRAFRGEKPPRVRRKTKKDETEPFIPTGPSKKQATPGDFFGTFGPVLDEFSPVQRKKPKFVHEKPNPVTNPGRKGGPGYIDITIAEYPEYIGGRPRKQPKPIKPRAGPLVSIHYPQPYFQLNPYRDPLQDPPSKKWYNPPREPKLDKNTKKSMKKLAGRPVFQPTGPAKWLGGCKAGCFSKWPAWEKDKWLNPLEKEQMLAGTVIPFLYDEFFPQSCGFKTMYDHSTLCTTDYSMNETNWKTYEPKWVKRLLKSMY